MVKLLLFAVMVLILSGCATSQPITFKTEVQTSLVPVLYSPAPPVIVRPELPIHKITNEELQQDGMVAKYYKATVKTLIGYAKELEAGLAEYDKINKAYKAEEEKLKEKLGTTSNELPKE